MFIPYNGYEQLLPRVVAQLVTYLPLADAAKAFACTGALIAARNFPALGAKWGAKSTRKRPSGQSARHLARPQHFAICLIYRW